jgi:hypothetical protein
MPGLEKLTMFSIPLPFIGMLDINTFGKNVITQGGISS